MPAPPRPAQVNSGGSYFSQFAGFQARDNTSFDNEFDRLACSQDWQPGSQQFRKERTRAAVAEVERHYFAPAVPTPPAIKEEVHEESDEELLYLTALDEDSEEQEDDTNQTRPKEEDVESASTLSKSSSSVTSDDEEEEEVKDEEGEMSHTSSSSAKDRPGEILDYITQRAEPASQDRKVRNLQGYQRLCLEVRAPMHDTIEECVEALSKTFVNIEDLIDARRIGTPVKVWESLDALAEYIVKEERVFAAQEAKGTYIESLLQKLPAKYRAELRSSRRRRVEKHKALKAEDAKSKVDYKKVASGRVSKSEGSKRFRRV